MIQQVLNKQLLQDILGAMKGQAQASVADERRATTDTPLDDMGKAEKEELLNDIETAEKHAREGKEETSERRGGESDISMADRNTYIPQSAELSNLQAAIEQYFLEKRADVVEESVDSDDRRGGSEPMAGSKLTIWQDYLDDRRLFNPFEQTDIGWISALFAQGVRKFRARHKFIERPVRKDPIPFNDENVRMIVFGDWGSGIPRAQTLATRIRLELDDPSVKNWQKFAIHLGDVYYAGWEYEYKTRFLKYWPVKPEEKETIGSLTLNGNHDMYSGGWAYYDCALAEERFLPWQVTSSLFHMANNHWQLFGLDTSHDDAGLKGDQAAWVCSAARSSLKSVLLSHHQYCSSFEDAPREVIEKIQPVLNSLDVAAWLWGHEHRCMTYKDVQKIRFPRCIGHGGVPVYQFHEQSAAVPSPGDWEYRDYLDGGLEHWAKFGFATLDFNRDKIAVRYLDENGEVNRTEVIV